MVDLLGRSGYLDEAEDLVNNMPIEPNASVWGALLGACRVHGNTETGNRAAECLFQFGTTKCRNIYPDVTFVCHGWQVG